MEKFIYVFLSLQILAFVSIAQQPLRGKVLLAEDHSLLPGTIIKLDQFDKTYVSNDNGEFTIPAPNGLHVFHFSYIGYKTKEVLLNLPYQDNLIVYLEREENELKNVVISTGYQKITQEKATGAFSVISNKLFDRSVGTDVLGRLADVVPGLIFNKNTVIAQKQNSISIRGQSTLFANTKPLIIIDNFPYEGDINAINPNDVDNITILKDAAAASIWGARAGNGVIVISTKQGKYKQALKISFSANVITGARPDLFYEPKMSSADYIGMEQKLFSQGFYKNAEQSLINAPLTPVVELLIAKRDGKIDVNEADRQIEALKSEDIRRDISKYLYRNSFNQQYALNIMGGDDNQRFTLSVGYDNNKAVSIGNGYKRLTLNANHAFKILKDKMEVVTGFYYTNSKTENNSNGSNDIKFNNSAIYPYARLVDDFGNPINIASNYRQAFLESSLQKGFLDWSFSPLNEINQVKNVNNTNDYRLNFGVNYRLFPTLKAEILYQYTKSNAYSNNLHLADSYYSRNLINSFTTINKDGSLIRNIPLGSIADKSYSEISHHNFRTQLNFNQSWGNQHQLTALGGYEVNDMNSQGNSFRLYGYDNVHSISRPVDYVNLFPQSYAKNNFLQIPNNEKGNDLTDRFLSFYVNAAYTWRQKYALSLSGRIDQSNLFGVKTNQKSIPLYSAGMAWNIDQEQFYNLTWLPYLKFRFTYGYNGNIDKSISGYTTAVYNSGGGTYTGLPYASIVNPPNPELRWERVRIVNVGLDFGGKGSSFSGTIDLYRKYGMDLIGDASFPSSTGVSVFRSNTASTRSNGLEFTINSRNINREIKWDTNVIFSYNKEIVSKYEVENVASNYLYGGVGGAYPLVGKPLYAMYSYRWAGLNAKTGEAQGYLDGDVSNDYNRIVQSATPENLVYNGPSRPAYFGAIRNTISYRNLSISANVSFRLGYYFRRNSVNYNNILSGTGGHGDFGIRWQNPGDEKITQVPSLPITRDFNQNNFYANSEVLVEKGDHFRLQDIRISYDFSKENFKYLPFTHAQVFVYANNIGLIWTANKKNMDPDYQLMPLPRTIAFGLKIDF
ncbi:SusC/RagA family TonB-linked outer membrane protein [Pedobacter sp. PAMC26386]|nr:SusC/RagA family TonB-linked outer membrane protein [Pedobacter sp. PAMC26386]